MSKTYLALFVVSFFVQSVHAQSSTTYTNMSCRNILFLAEAFDRFKISISNMNGTGLLNDVVLVQDSPLLRAIRRSNLEDVKIAAEERIAQSASATLIYEIAVVIAMAIELEEDPKIAAEEYIAKHTGTSFFDEIAIAIALGEDAIARYLFENSSFDFRRTPMGKDLLMTAVYFGNARMLHFLESKGVVFVAPEKAKALRYATLSNSANVMYFLLRNTFENP